MKRLRQEQGLTLIETTVILAVVTILSGMLAPSILQFIEDSKVTRARNDVQTIATSLGRFFQDTGHFPVTTDSVQGGLGSEFVDVLVSHGQPPRIGQAAASTQTARAGVGVAYAASTAAASDIDRWASRVTDLLDNHLVKNRAGFSLRGPLNNRGWNGPYVSSELSGDPWGNQYLVNVAYLDSEVGVADARGVSKNAVFVLCAGANQILETPFTQPIVNAEVFGDDIGVRIR